MWNYPTTYANNVPNDFLLYSELSKFSQGTINFSLPVLVHELLLGNGEGAEFVAKGVFILSNNDKHVKTDCSKLSQDKVINCKTYLNMFH